MHITTVIINYTSYDTPTQKTCTDHSNFQAMSLSESSWLLKSIDKVPCSLRASYPCIMCGKISLLYINPMKDISPDVSCWRVCQYYMEVQY